MMAGTKVRLVWEHRKLLVYGRALEAYRAVDPVARAIPDARRDLRDQLWRAAASVVLNIAEGAGEYKPAEKARFYRMARRSSAECAAVLDLLALSCPTLSTTAAEARLSEVAAMLTVLVKSL